MRSDRGGGARQRWNALSRPQRVAIVVLGLFEAVAKAAMLVDLRRRPAEQVRGRKRLWAATALVNSAGLAQVAYFVVGRKRP